jgi:hypothetical protein
MEGQAMKKLAVLMILVMSALMLKAGGEATSYVTFDGKTYFCQKVTPGLFNMNLTLDDGSILKVPLKKVDAYSSNGHLCERLPVRCEGAPANCTALMEYVTSRNGFRLYKLCEYGECGSLWDNTYQKAHLQVEYYVFKDGKFHLQVTKDNVGSVLQFFNVPVIG